MTKPPTKPTIGILGCGWLGLPLAERLLAAGYPVKGATTRAEKVPLLREAGIAPYQILLEPTGVRGDIGGLLEAEILVLNIPPGRTADSADAYETAIQLLVDMIEDSPVAHVLFTSSVAVYPDLQGIATEATLPVSGGLGPGAALARIEQLLLGVGSFQATVLRMGTLVGQDRPPGRLFAGKTNLRNGNARVNFLHRDDGVGILEAIIAQGKWGQTYNAVADLHPKYRLFYPYAAQRQGFIAPTFAPPTDDARFKIVANDKLKDDLHYEFRFPDPFSMF